VTQPTPTEEITWCLEGFVDPDKRAWRTVIRSLPLAVGRNPGVDLQLLSDKVSKRHAEIFWADGQLWLRDLASTNGTFLNGDRVSDARPLEMGDTLRFADLEMRLAQYDDRDQTRTRTLSETELNPILDPRDSQILQMLDSRAVRAVYQPVVRLEDLAVMGYEMLSRGDLDGFETAPKELFSLAERAGCEAELSQLCREQGIRAATDLANAFRLFINTHPAELQNPKELIESLIQVRERWPELRLVVEIHEAALTDVSTMREIRESLRSMEVELAFDDFGTGQSRLSVIGEVPPDFLKFDIAFVSGLDTAPEGRRKLVHELVRMTRAMGVLPIAEGIESEGELEACREAGFSWAQGYALGQLSEPSELPTGG
jgi:EAL domain-containing protein (putative c-di-GMP-specific phosphodiesterase class I)